MKISVIRLTALFAFLYMTFINAPHPEANEIQTITNAVKVISKELECSQYEGLKKDLGTLADAGHALSPVSIFLLGELSLMNGDDKAAADAYFSTITRKYIKGNTGDANKWGESGLEVFALWRWLKLFKKGNIQDKDAKEILSIVENILHQKQSIGMTEVGHLPSIPQIKEEIYRDLCDLALKINKPKKASTYLLGYLKNLEDFDSQKDIKDLVQKLVDNNQVGQEQIDLYNAKRLYSTGNYNKSAMILNKIVNDSEGNIAAEAGILLSQIWRMQNKGCDAMLNILNDSIEAAKDPEIAQKAILISAKLKKHKTCGTDDNGYRNHLKTLLEDFPNGEYADEALFRLAINFQSKGDSESFKTALAYFEQLRGLKEDNDWLNSAYYRPAIALYIHDKKKEALVLLEELNHLYPDGELYLHSEFWKGRIYEDLGETKKAKEAFDNVIQRAPYSYYSIRSLIHKNTKGNKAKEITIASRNSLDEIVNKQKTISETEGLLSQPSNFYHKRLNTTIESGLYKHLGAAYETIRKEIPGKRLNNTDLNSLTSNKYFTQLVVFLSLRQDAIAARDLSESTEDILQLAHDIGKHGKDWILSQFIVNANGKPYYDKWNIQKKNLFLEIAFPRLYYETILEKAGMNTVSPDIIYSIMREESNFSPTAISNRGAVGLMQFNLQTITTLYKRWKNKYPVFKGVNKDDLDAFRMNPEKSIELWALWFSKSILKRNNGNIVFSVMEHNAGRPSVVSWIKEWEKNSHDKDIELIVETADFSETRNFARRVLRDLSILKSIGMFTD